MTTKEVKARKPRKTKAPKKPKELTRGEKVIAFIEKYCPVPEGKLCDGRLMVLDPFQKNFILRVYDNPLGTNLAILSMARKNGKTALIAALVLVHVAGPEAKQNTQLVSGARSRDQAALVFNLAVKMINLSPQLKARIHVVPSLKKLIGLRKNTEFQALSAEASTKHGLSPWLVIFDELGQVRGPKDAFVEALETAQGAYDDGLKIVISTQAPTDADMLSVWIDDALRSKDPHTVIELHAADAGKDKQGRPKPIKLDDKKMWKKANPALGTFRSLPELERMAERAQRMPSFENSFRNLYLNERINAVARFVSPTTWATGNSEVQSLVGLEVFGGLDLSGTTDLTSLVLTGRDEGILHVAPFFWIPENMVQIATDRDRAPYDDWVRDGFLRTTPGNVIDYAFVARDIGQIVGGLNIIKLGFDRWRMDRLKNAMTEAALELPLEEFGQGFQSMSPALDALEQDLLNGVVRHGGHPVLDMCAANAVTIKDPAGNRKLDKIKSTGRIDGMVALTIAEGVEAKLKGEPSDVEAMVG